jgi:hypothetical protein
VKPKNVVRAIQKIMKKESDASINVRQAMGKNLTRSL